MDAARRTPCHNRIIGTYLNAHGKKCCSSTKSTFFNHPITTRPGTSSAMSVPGVDQVAKIEHCLHLTTEFLPTANRLCKHREFLFYFNLLPIELLNIHLKTHQSTVALSSTHSSGLGQAKSQGRLESLHNLGSRQVKDQAEIGESTSMRLLGQSRWAAHFLCIRHALLACTLIW
jgi:hypothetical protein